MSVKSNMGKILDEVRCLQIDIVSYTKKNNGYEGVVNTVRSIHGDIFYIILYSFSSLISTCTGELCDTGLILTKLGKKMDTVARSFRDKYNINKLYNTVETEWYKNRASLEYVSTSMKKPSFKKIVAAKVDRVKSIEGKESHDILHTLRILYDLMDGITDVGDVEDVYNLMEAFNITLTMCEMVDLDRKGAEKMWSKYGEMVKDMSKSICRERKEIETLKTDIVRARQSMYVSRSKNKKKVMEIAEQIRNINKDTRGKNIPSPEPLEEEETICPLTNNVYLPINDSDND